MPHTIAQAYEDILPSLDPRPTPHNRFSITGLKYTFRRLDAHFGTRMHYLWFIPCCVIALVFFILLIMFIAAPDRKFSGHKADHWMWFLTTVIFGVSLTGSLLFYVCWAAKMLLWDWWKRIGRERLGKYRGARGEREGDLEELFEDSSEEEEEVPFDGDAMLAGTVY